MQQYILSKTEADRIQSLFPAKYPVIQTHHVTYCFDAKTKGLPPKFISGEIVGYADDGEIECVVVEILTKDGKITHQHNGKNLLHITLSHTPNRKPAHSNKITQNAVPVGPYSFQAKATVR